jgi:Predicted transcriptional regulators
MNIELGRKIKRLRAERNMTQDSLAAALGVSPQAVSKWENGVTAPDIGLLPAISVAFGVTIDELFSLSDDENLERICNMLGNVRDLTETNFMSTESQLQGIIARKPGCGDAYLRLAQLYENRINSFTRLAVDYAKQAVRIMPDKKGLSQRSDKCAPRLRRRLDLHKHAGAGALLPRPYEENTGLDTGLGMAAEPADRQRPAGRSAFGNRGGGF